MSPRESEILYQSEDELSTASESVDHDTVKKSVSFGAIQIREYDRVLGDNPDVRVGPPVSIGWDFVQLDDMALDHYETTRPKKKLYLRMSSITRKNLLKNVFDVPEEEIRAAEKEVQKIQKQRSQTKKQGKSGAKVESVLKAAKRRLRRTFSTEGMRQGFATSSADGGMIPMSAY